MVSGQDDRKPDKSSAHRHSDMLEEFEVRVARVEDDGAIGRLATELGYPSSTGEARSRLRDLLELRDHQVYVAATREGEVVGWVHVFGSRTLVSEPFAEVGGLVVSEQNRGKGVGTLLLRVSEEWAKASGYSVMRVRSRVIRTEAHKFYEDRGYGRLKTQEVFLKDLETHD